MVEFASENDVSDVAPLNAQRSSGAMPPTDVDAKDLEEDQIHLDNLKTTAESEVPLREPPAKRAPSRPRRKRAKALQPSPTRSLPALEEPLVDPATVPAGPARDEVTIRSEAAAASRLHARLQQRLWGGTPSFCLPRNK